MKIFVKTLGCRANRYESEKLMQELIEIGHEIVAEPDDAEAIVVNTCTVTHTADRKSRQEIYPHVWKGTSPPRSLIVVFGCGPRVGSYEIEGVDLVAKEPAEVLEFFRQVGAPKKRKTDGIFLTRSNLKIQDGCENFCTYCIIPFARGKCVSKPYDEVLREASKMILNGTKEIVLTGINIGEWKDGHLDFWDFMKILLDELPVRIRISSLEPFLWDDRVEEISKQKNFCQHLHICAQSGCDTVLKRMGRHYETSDFKNLIKKIRSIVPDIAITTDIITGFPRETDEEHHETLKFIKDVNFAKVHVFKYSRREGTPAAKAKGQIPYDVKIARSREIRELADGLRRDYQEKFVGKTLDVLFEHGRKTAFWPGTTGNYLQVEVKSGRDLRGELCSVRLGMLKKNGRFAGRRMVYASR